MRKRQTDRDPYLELWVEREKILLQIGWQVAVGGEDYIQNREELPETKSSKARGKIGVDTKNIIENEIQNMLLIIKLPVKLGPASC